jgi:type VI secretion system secreted protein Hcp
MRYARHGIALIATVAGLFGSSGALAAVDTFLKIDGIQGESIAKGFEGASDVFSWSWGAASTPDGKKGCIQEMDVTKSVDSASPALITNAATGAVAPKAVLTMRKPGEGGGNFLIITMTNVRVSSYQIAASSGAGSLAESVSLNFEIMSGVYRKQKEDGSFDAGTPWNIGPNSGKCP